MKLYKLIFLVLAIGITSCRNSTSGQQVYNTIPMYGEVPKSDEIKKIDDDFRKECLKEYKTLDSSVNVQIYFGWSYYYHDTLKTAMKRFNQAWLLNPEFPDSYFGFAALLETQGNKKDADRFYKLGMEKDTKKDRAEICLGKIADIKEHLKDIKGAIDAHKRIVEINPNNSLAFKKIGFLSDQIGDTATALLGYNKAIELDPTDAMTYNNRAYFYQVKKNYSAAITDYTKAIEIDSKYISAYVNRGITEVEMNNNLAAKKDFEVCVQLDSKDAGLRRFLGLAKLNLKDKSGACQDFQLARQLGDPQAAELIKQNCK